MVGLLTKCLIVTFWEAFQQVGMTSHKLKSTLGMVRLPIGRKLTFLETSKSLQETTCTPRSTKICCNLDSLLLCYHLTKWKFQLFQRQPLSLMKRRKQLHLQGFQQFHQMLFCKSELQKDFRPELITSKIVCVSLTTLPRVLSLPQMFTQLTKPSLVLSLLVKKLALS